jgi:competence protein ComEA
MRKDSSIRDNWKDYFSFPKKLRNALFALLLVMVLEIATLFYLHFSPSSSTPTNFSEFQKEIDAFYASKKTDTINDHLLQDNSETITPELFAFNPNNLPEEDWKRLGFTDKQIHVIKNYEQKGGRFQTKADVKKMYSISAEQFASIEPYLQIPNPQSADSSSHKITYKKYERPVVIVDVGTADSLELLKLPAVGPSFARRIFNYREKLGGFYSINQLKEVWNLTDSIFQIISPHAVLKDSSNVRKIDINTADYKTFNMHPYIDKSQAYAIIAYRNQHGPFHSIEDIKKVALFNEELYSKLAPYLKID